MVRILTKQITNDSYYIEEETENKFKEHISLVNKSTESVDAYITQSTILSFKEKEDIDIDGSTDVLRIYKFYAFDDESLTKKTYETKTVNFKTVLVKGEPNSKSLFLDEIINSTGLLIKYKDQTNRIYMDGVSKVALKSLCERAGLRGERYNINSFFRDAYIAGGLVSIPDHKASRIELCRYDNLVTKGLTFIRRKNPNNNYKLGLIVGVFSGGYIETPVDILSKTFDYFNKLKSVGDIDIDKYSFTQEETRVSYYFTGLTAKYNKKYKIDFPIKVGLETYKSDTGKISLSADLFFEIYGVKYIYKNVTKKQGELIKVKEFTNAIKRNLIAFIEEFYKTIKKTREFKFNSNIKKSFYYDFLMKQLNINPSIKAALGKKRIEKISESFYDTIINEPVPNDYYTLLKMLFELISNNIKTFNLNDNNFYKTMLDLYKIDVKKNDIYKEVVLNG